MIDPEKDSDKDGHKLSDVQDVCECQIRCQQGLGAAPCSYFEYDDTNKFCHLIASAFDESNLIPQSGSILGVKDCNDAATTRKGTTSHTTTKY